jgi:hypothetical protein
MCLLSAFRPSFMNSGIAPQRAALLPLTARQNALVALPRKISKSWNMLLLFAILANFGDAWLLE